MRLVWVIFNIILWTIILAGGGLILSIFEWKGKILGGVAHLWSKLILSVSGVKYIVKGNENIDTNQNYIFAGNHESAFDIPLVFAGIKHHVVSISKIELKWVPIFGWAMQAAKHIFVNRKNKNKAIKSLKKAAISLHNNPRSVVVFPEGTRSKNGEINQFKKGGLLLAIESQLPVVPMAICGTMNVLVAGSWKLKPSTVELHLGTPIETTGLTYNDRDYLTKKTYEEVVRLKDNWLKHN